jgi:hypothetical protein
MPWSTARVTGLGEFSTVGRLLALGTFENYRSSTNFYVTYTHSNSNGLFVTKKSVGQHFGRFFTNSSGRPLDHGCQMVCFQTKNTNLGKFWGVLQWKILVYFMIFWSILRPLEIFYGHLIYFVVIWYISLRFGILYLENLATLLSTAGDVLLFRLEISGGRKFEKLTSFKAQS